MPCRAGLKAMFIFDETGSSEPSYESPATQEFPSGLPLMPPAGTTIA